MKKFSLFNLFLLSATLFLCLLTGCGIPNYSPVSIMSVDIISSTKAVISGDVISLYSSELRQDEPKICFFYMIAPSSSSYYSNLVSAFSSSYVSNTNMNHISYSGSNQPFLTSRVTYNGNAADVGLYQFSIDSSNTDSDLYNNKLKSHLESFISGESDFTEILSDSYSSSFSFTLDNESNEIIFSFIDQSGSENKVYLKRFNNTVFSTDQNNDGSDYIGNEVPSGFNLDSSSNLSIFVFASVEAAFNDESFNNVLHSSLKIISEITL